MLLTWQAASVIIVLGLAIAGYVISIERRLNARITWRAHTDQCDAKHDKVLDAIRNLDSKVDRNYREADRKRTLLSDKVSIVSRQVAVLRDRMARSPDDTGGFAGPDFHDDDFKEN